MYLLLTFATTSDSLGFRLVRASYCDSDLAPTNGFNLGWSKGIGAFLLLTLQTKLGFLEQPQKTYILEGQSNSAAHILYRSLDELGHLAWPRVIFGNNSNYQDCLKRSSQQGRLGKTYSVCLDPTQIPSENLRIWLDEDEISNNREAISKLITAILNPNHHHRQEHLRLGILRSGDLAYTRDIETGLRHRLSELNYDHTSIVSHAGPQVSPMTDSGRIQWEIAFQQLHERSNSNLDYVVAIGTQAIQAIRLSYGDKLGKPPNPRVIFLGVTYPVASHIVDSLYSRYETREVCGVAYGADGLRSIASLVHNWLVPKCQMKFIYSNEYSQDRDAADQLRRTRLFAQNHLLIQEITPESVTNAVADPNIIYFSWYTIESILESNDITMYNISQLLRDRKVVATTRSNCAHGLTFAAVGADDVEIGKQGAELLHGQLNGSIPHLGRQNILIPRIRYWINQVVADRQNISFTPEVLSEAKEVFN
ncbi:MAG: hypothetical protein N2255_00505 [Kiritimatiellae bacterium]|jgi:ABC-type uncharacterized transport system substrate-binding protein|nr:hypothetical protein [Kiritimatiellia bacterium]